MLDLELFDLNIKIFKLINEHNLPFLDILFYAITYLGNGLIIVPLAAALYKIDREKILPVVASYLMSAFSVQVIKFLWNIPRPVALLDNVHIVGEILKAASFPSGHMATAFGLFYVLTHGKGKGIKFGILFLALAVGYSRIYVGAHFPLDVLGGGLIGLAAGYVSIKYSGLFKSHWKELLVLFVIPSIIFLYRLGAFPFFIVDEARNSEAAREMLQRMDFLVPTYNYELRTDKPPLHYWFFMLAYKLFGVEEFSSRVTSAVLGIGTVLATYFFAARRLNKGTALLSAIILPTCLYSFLLFRMAVPDPFLVFFSTLALFFFYTGRVENNYRYTVLFYICVGLAVMTKGPVGFLLPFGVAFMFEFFLGVSNRQSAGERNPPGFMLSGLRPLRIFLTSRHLIGYLIVAAIAVPWYIIVSVKTGGAFASGFFLHHNIDRFKTSLEGPKGHFFSVVFLVLGFLPWSFFLVQTVVSSYKEKKDPLVLFLLIWTIVHLLFYSISATQLPHYLVPVYPALSILVAKVFLRDMPFRKLAAVLIGAIGLLLSVALLILGGRYAKDMMPWIGFIGVPFFIGGTVMFFRTGYAPHILAASMLSFILFCTGWLMPASGRYFIPEKISDAVHQFEEASGAQIGSIYSYGYYDPAFEYYTRKKIIKIKEVSLLPSGAILVSTSDKLSKLPELKYRQLYQFDDKLRKKAVVIVKIL